MSEELRQKGYLKRGKTVGERVGPYEGFNLGATTFEQLRAAGIIPDTNYGRHAKLKPDAIVVDRRGPSPIVKFVAEFKDIGGLSSLQRTFDFSEKVADEYCRPLGCELGGISDSQRHSWLLVTSGDWRPILREDDYPLDYPIDLSREEGRLLIGRTIQRLETSLNKPKAHLEPVEAVNPTRLAEQTWQDIWLACGEQPEACLATFIELLIFKFLSDLGVLKYNLSGIPVDFETVLKKTAPQILPYYFEMVRPEIKRIFPAGDDNTSIINGIVFNPAATDQGRLFQQILQRFEDFGSLKRIDPEFKSRIFERFLKKSMSVKNWGQFFTPRNVVKAMVEMSGVERLPPGSVLADPASGVGGFLLEPLMNKRPYDYRTPDYKGIRYVGWDRDDKTVVLAKANMLIHLSEAIEQNPKGSTKYLSKALNDTFHSVSSSLTGSLQRVPVEEFDLVLTNIPYVIRGTGKQRALLDGQKDYFSIPGSGLENLFMQLIINGLKPGCLALIVVPDGLLMRHSEEPMRRHILETCVLEGLISLPINTFYSTPKKTYILALRKKQMPVRNVQTQPVFTYLVNRTGETLDAKRFTISENDLPQMASLFKQFQGNPEAFQSIDPRCKIFPADRFHNEDHWMVNKWWTIEERENLGDVDAECFVGPSDLEGRLKEVASVLSKQAAIVSDSSNDAPIDRTVTLSLSDARYFRMSIGERVIEEDLFYKEKGTVPLYSANVEAGNEHGWIKQSKITDFSRPSVLWSIDSDFNMSVRPAGQVFDTTDHCGRLEILDDNLDPAYCQAAIMYGYGRTFGFDRVMRPSIKRMKKVSLRVPIKPDGSFDLKAQASLAQKFTAVQSAIQIATENLESLKDLKPMAEIPSNVCDIGAQPGSCAMPERRRAAKGSANERDAKVATLRLEEISRDPKQVVRGSDLAMRLEMLTKK